MDRARVSLGQPSSVLFPAVSETPKRAPLSFEKGTEKETGVLQKVILVVGCVPRRRRLDFFLYDIQEIARLYFVLGIVGGLLSPLGNACAAFSFFFVFLSRVPSFLSLSPFFSSIPSAFL